MKKRAYLAGVILIVPLLCGMSISASNNTAVKISKDGIVKPAKDIGTGKGIAFTLPYLEDEGWILNTIELAVFEKQESESEWHIYKDEKGQETKRRFIESPTSLNVDVNFGDLSDYREKAKYKIGYRYYVESIYDMSKLVIAGGDTKDGWRIVGEDNPTDISKDGFTFYLNSVPQIALNSLFYTKHTIDGDVTAEVSASELDGVYLPKDAFKNGVRVKCDVSDFDKEDILSVSYCLKDGNDNTISEGTLQHDIKADITGDTAKLKLICDDGFGGVCETDWYEIHIDDTLPFVKSEFDDMGYSVRGGSLYSDFHIYDDETDKMTKGNVAAHIIKDSKEVKVMSLSGKSGIYKLNTPMPDGEYTVELDIYDNNGNIGKHTFYQTLDSTPPTARYVTDSENAQATKYNTWINSGKKVIVYCSDDISGLDNCKIVEKNNTVKVWENISAKSFTADYQINEQVTGIINYGFYCFDRAKDVDTSNNCVKVNSEGNMAEINNTVKIDKNPPEITTSINPDEWYTTPITVTVSVNDKPTKTGINDNSGILEKKYAITGTEDKPSTYTDLSNTVTVSDAGIVYLHLYAIDNAGNETYKTVKIKTNSACTVSAPLKPTDDYLHTIYYSEDNIYVIKNTAYNTKFHIGLSDKDITDTLKVTARLVSRDNPELFVEKTVTVQPTGSIVRDVSFNIPYTKDNETLPDGVYDIYISVTEIKDGQNSFAGITDMPEAVIIIKRNAPPTPVISTDSGMVEIEYPKDNLPGSLDNSEFSKMYKREYKATKEGVTGVYKDYDGSFSADNVTVTALYTDMAGNTSISSKRIKKSAADKNTVDIAKTGNVAAVEESRQANVYYIGTRRDKKTGINADVFKFIK